MEKQRQRRRCQRSWTGLVVLAITTGCGSFGATIAGSDGVGNQCEEGKRTVLTGVVTTPDGQDPVPGALVYVPRGQLAEPAKDDCNCQSIGEQSMVWTTTGPDGSFKLAPLPTARDQRPGTMQTVVVQMGKFRRVAEVAINSPCGDNRADDQALRLPARTAGQDRVPRIAVATGEFDVMECVLHNMGLDPGALDLYEGRSGPTGLQERFPDLLRNGDKLASYDILVINCADNGFESMLTDPLVTGNIERFVSGGGRLYVTDWSYDYVEQIAAFAPAIDFAPDVSGAAPELADQAALGDDGLQVNATVRSQQLRAWLEAVEQRGGDELVSPAGEVPVGHFVSGWAMQREVPARDRTMVWLEGPVTGVGLSGVQPLTTSFDHGSCGRVLFSSYHTVGSEAAGQSAFPGYCSSQALTPQERVLQYLIYHVSDCVGDHPDDEKVNPGEPGDGGGVVVE